MLEPATGLTWSTLAAFAWTSLIVELTPGPNMTTLAVLSAREGRRAGTAAVAGVALGLLLVGIAASLGLATLLAQSRWLYETIRWAGVLYLLWLAWEGWHGTADVSPDPVDGAEADIRYFRQGLITNMLNPKAGVFYLSILPSFIDAALPVLSQTMTLTAVYVSIATAIHLAIVALADRSRALLDDPGRRQTARRILSLMLAVVALWLAWTTRRSA
jgi:threonine/homoserine/homoserine lactone efflux protein